MSLCISLVVTRWWNLLTYNGEALQTAPTTEWLVNWNAKLVNVVSIHAPLHMYYVCVCACVRGVSEGSMCLFLLSRNGNAGATINMQYLQLLYALLWLVWQIGFGHHLNPIMWQSFRGGYSLHVSTAVYGSDEFPKNNIDRSGWARRALSSLFWIFS